MIQHEEGRIVPKNGGFDYQYHLKDHLGNVRVTVDEGGDVVQSDDYYPFGGTFNSYQKVGSTSQNVLYNSKELLAETGWLDYGARMYDPWSRLGFTSIDPSAENYYSWSPYNYVANNPVRLIDPNGKDWYEDKDGNYRWVDSQESTLTLDGNEWNNIGQTLYIIVNSYIHEDNDIPIPGVAGDKLWTEFSITGDYDDDGNFLGFSTEHESTVGYTFGLIKGGDGVEGKEESFNAMTQMADGFWIGGFEHHTEVGELEKPGMYGLFGNVVDVSQKVRITIGSTGQLTFEIGHGTFPSVQAWSNGEVIYDFRQYSFLKSHSSGIANTLGLIDAALYQTISNEANKQAQQTNKPFVKFTGFTSGIK